MTELFRFIEHRYVLPETESKFINVEDQTDFQESIRNNNTALEAPNIMEAAGKLLDSYVAGQQVISLENKLWHFSQALKKLKNPSRTDVDKLVTQLSDGLLREFTAGAAFRKDKSILNDLLVAVKLTTGFNRLNASKLVAVRQAMYLLDELSTDTQTELTKAALFSLLELPVYVPPDLFPVRTIKRPAEDEISEAEKARERETTALKNKAQALKTTYDSLMSVSTRQLETPPPSDSADAADLRMRPVSINLEHGPRLSAHSSNNSIFRALENAGIDATSISLTEAVAAVRKQMEEVAGELDGILTQQPIKLYQVGIHTYADKPASGPAKEDLPDFSFAVTRPVGVGDLQVVRQELIGYEPGEVSHIENVMQGELFRRGTIRLESTESSLTEESETTQMEERDVQSTERNELASETQKEAGQESSSAEGASSSRDYGKLVENNKSNHARTVTDKAVNNVSQRVRQVRFNREQKSFQEKILHEFNNQKNDQHIKGIYQWVDKKYKNHLISYGKRLLYDVVLPEPAAFLIESQKKAQQPEGFTLVKPMAPMIPAKQIHHGNFMDLAQAYGVTGNVTAPPDDFMTARIKLISDKVDKVGDAYFYTGEIEIPDGYSAYSGRFQTVYVTAFDQSSLPPEQHNSNFLLQVWIGKHHILYTLPNDDELLLDFLMENETGQVPILLRTFSPVANFASAVTITCIRGIDGWANWQLKTHAIIMQGYRRQLAEYEDKLSRYLQSIRVQMALSGNAARNDSIQRTELKRMFIHLLVSEHLLSVGYPTPVNNAFFFATDPHYVNKWGAVVAFFERAFEWNNIMYVLYPYFYGRLENWPLMVLRQDVDGQFEEFLKAGAARVVVPVRPGFEGALAHYHETGTVWMGEEIPDIYSKYYVSIINEIKARNYAPGDEICLEEWEVKLPTTLVMLKDDAALPEWTSTMKCKHLTE